MRAGTKEASENIFRSQMSFKGISQSLIQSPAVCPLIVFSHTLHLIFVYHSRQNNEYREFRRNIFFSKVISINNFLFFLSGASNSNADYCAIDSEHTMCVHTVEPRMLSLQKNTIYTVEQGTFSLKQKEIA